MDFSGTWLDHEEWVQARSFILYPLLILAQIQIKVEIQCEFIRVNVKMLENRFADEDFSGQARYQERCLQLVSQTLSSLQRQFNTELEKKKIQDASVG